VGGIFAAFITTLDFRRMRKELQLGNVPASCAFGVATIFDIVDCLAHIFTAICNLYHTNPFYFVLFYTLTDDFTFSL
jgi:hypothetical protein